jgi:hypothetical protein
MVVHGLLRVSWLPHYVRFWHLADAPRIFSDVSFYPNGWSDRPLQCTA